VTRAVIKRARCVTCRRCIKVCESGAISLDGDSCVADQTLCAGCQACVAVCRTNAIAMMEPARATE